MMKRHSGKKHSVAAALRTLKRAVHHAKKRRSKRRY